MQATNMQAYNSMTSMQMVDTDKVAANGCLSAAKSATKLSKTNLHNNTFVDGRSSFSTERERQSFNAIISMHGSLEQEEESTTEHKVCGVIGFITCFVLLWMLIYGEITHWRHSSYIIDKADNSTKIYNTSFIVRCSWNSRRISHMIPIHETYERSFDELCDEKVPHSCLMKYAGKIWFGSLLCTFIIVFIANIILLWPHVEIGALCNNKLNCIQSLAKIWSLKYVRYMFVVCGALCFLSMIPITGSLDTANDICGDANYSEWDEDTYDGYIENVDTALWTLYLPPVIGILLCFVPCFLSQIRTVSDV